MKRLLSNPVLIVAVIGIILAFTNSAAFFYHLSRQPEGTVYLGTIHYWEDYFFLLNQFFQGAHGRWLPVIQYTGELFPTTIIYWNNVMMGKIGSLVGLSPIITYNLMVIILSFASLMASYFTLRLFFPKSKSLPVLAFIFSALATSFPNRVTSNTGEKIMWPFQIWGTPHFAFDRLGGAPHHLLRTLMTYIFIWLLFSDRQLKMNQLKTGITVLVAVILTTVNPTSAAMVFGLFIAVKFIRYVQTKKIPFTKPDLIRYFLTGILISVFFLIINAQLDSPAYRFAKLWDSSQNSFTTIPFLVASIGPVLVLALIGLIVRIRKLTDIEIFGVIFLFASYTFFLSPLPKLIGVSNLRILFPASYIFFGAFAASGTVYLTGRLKTYLHLSRQTGIILIVIIFISLSLPTLIWEIKFRLPENLNTNDPLLYLPTGVYKGYEFLNGKKPFTDVTLANPDTHMDILVPALAGHNTYVGHFAETIDYNIKKPLAERFFHLEMDPTEAVPWLFANRVKYVIFTFYDGNRTKFELRYPFLIKIFENDRTAVYTTQ